MRLAPSWPISLIIFYWRFLSLDWCFPWAEIDTWLRKERYDGRLVVKNNSTWPTQRLHSDPFSLFLSLHQVEYYCGILFLTTNRVKAFDEAFLSRIHVVLHFVYDRFIQKSANWDVESKCQGIYSVLLTIGPAFEPYLETMKGVLRQGGANKPNPVSRVFSFAPEL